MKRTPEEVFTELLVLRTQEGDVSAWRQLVEVWQQRLYRHARHLTGNHEVARDITQDAWLAMLRGIRRLEDPARFRPWAYRIVSNKAVDWARRQGRNRKMLESAQQEAERTENEQDGRADDGAVDELRRAIRLLPPKRRSLLTMFYVDGMPLVEISEALNLPLGTVKSRLHSTRQELKSLLKGNDR